jgi:MraZ protein
MVYNEYIKVVKSGVTVDKSGAKGGLKMLYGRYEHTVDAKNRVFVPAKYKEVLGGSFKLTCNGFTNCILLYTEREWEKFEEKPKTSFFKGAAESEVLINNRRELFLKVLSDSRYNSVCIKALKKKYVVLQKNSLLIHKKFICFCYTVLERRILIRSIYYGLDLHHKW